MNTNLGRTECAVLINKGGSSRAFGDVVIVDSANALSFTTTTTSGLVNARIGVVFEPNGIANDAPGLIAFSGYVPRINLASAAALGDYVKSHTVAGQGMPHAVSPQSGDFAQVLETGTNPSAMLFGCQIQLSTGGGAYFSPAGLTGATQASRYVGATASGAPTTGSFEVGDYVIDRSGLIWICTVAGSPGTWLSPSGGATPWWASLTNPSSPSWAWVNQGLATITSALNMEYLKQPAGAGVSYALRKITAPSTPYTITACFLFNPGGNSGNCQFNLFFRESSSGKFTGISHLVGGAIEVQKWNSPTSFNSNYVSSGSFRYAGMVWFQISDDGTNRIYKISTEGNNFVTLHSVTRTNFLTPDEVGFGLNIDTGNLEAGVSLISWKQT